MLAGFLILGCYVLSFLAPMYLPPRAIWLLGIALVVVLIVAGWLLDRPLLIPVLLAASSLTYAVFADSSWSVPFIEDLAVRVGEDVAAPLIWALGYLASVVATAPLLVFVRMVRADWDARTVTRGRFLGRLLGRTALVMAVLAPIMIGFAVMMSGLVASEALKVAIWEQTLRRERTATALAERLSVGAETTTAADARRSRAGHVGRGGCDRRRHRLAV